MTDHPTIRLIAALRRHLPGGRSRAVLAAFKHGYHAGHHDALGERIAPGERCEVWERIDR